jgi:hypothetical protein
MSIVAGKRLPMAVVGREDGLGLCDLVEMAAEVFIILGRIDDPAALSGIS